MILIVGATGYLGGMITRGCSRRAGWCECWCAPVRTTARWSRRAWRLPSATFDSGIPWMWHAAGSTR